MAQKARGGKKGAAPPRMPLKESPGEQRRESPTVLNIVFLREDKGDEGGPEEVHRSQGVGLHQQAGEHGAAPVTDAGLAV